MFSSELSPEQRGAAIAALGKEEFDVLVIGGGVTGAGAVLDAASRGLKVALVEARDIASGTSSRSSKLIHGGLRYLEQYDFKLVREALRMRPDRIAVGEVRGAELLVMLQALNTGHRGGGATIHANSFESVTERIGSIGWQCGLAAPELVAQAKSAIEWLIFVGRDGDRRRVLRIGRFN